MSLFHQITTVPQRRSAPARVAALDQLALGADARAPRSACGSRGVRSATAGCRCGKARTAVRSSSSVSKRSIQSTCAVVNDHEHRAAALVASFTAHAVRNEWARGGTKAAPPRRALVTAPQQTPDDSRRLRCRRTSRLRSTEAGRPCSRSRSSDSCRPTRTTNR